MARSSKKGMKKVKKKKMDRPFLLHVKPTSSDDSFDMTRQASQDCNSLIGCNDHSNLLLPAMVLVPPLSGADAATTKLKSLKGKDKNLELAAAHIEDAKTGRGEYGKAKYYFKPRHAQIAFKIITSTWFKHLIYLTVLIHSALTFIEPPSIALGSRRWEIIAICLNFFCLMIYLLDVVLHLDYLTCKVFWTHENFFWNRVEFIFLCGFAIDLILLIIQIAIANSKIVLPFRALRLAMVLCKAKNLGHIYNVVQSIIVKLGGIVFIFLIFIMVYSCIGVHLLMSPFEVIEDVNISEFRPEQQVDVDVILDEFADATRFTTEDLTVIVETCAEVTSAVYNESSIYQGTFDHVGIASYQLFILLTTENFPVFMFPAFQKSEWYFIYFGTFLTFGVFFLTAILLAIIANIYWEYNKKHVKKERRKQRIELIKAWKILDTCGNERIPVNDPELNKLFHLLKPKNTDEENRELIAELDPNKTGYVDWINWVTQLLDVLAFEKANSWQIRYKKIPCCNFACCKFIRRKTRSTLKKKAFEVAILLLIVIHSILFGFRWNEMAFMVELIFQGIRSGIVCIFMLESLLRLIGFGRSFFRTYNILDLSLVLAAFITNGLWYLSLMQNVMEKANFHVETFRAVLVVTSSIAVFFRLFFNSTKSRGVMTVFFRLFPIMWTLLVLFGIILYMYAVIGMAAFSQFEISEDTPSSDYFRYSCGLGFKNFRCSLYIMFQLLTTSNWHDILNSIILTLDTFAPLVYFFSFYIVVNLVIMNLLVAIGLEAFNKFAQEEKEKIEMEENSEENEEKSKKPKISGRFLLKGVVDMLADTFATTNQWQDEEGLDEEEERQTLPVPRRQAHSAPITGKTGRAATRIRPKSSGANSSRYRADPTITATTLFLGSSVPPSVGIVLPRTHSIQRKTPSSPHVVTVEVNEESEAQSSLHHRRQDMVRQKLQSRQKAKDTTTSSPRTGPPASLSLTPTESFSFSSLEKGPSSPSSLPPTPDIVPAGQVRRMSVADLSTPQNLDKGMRRWSRDIVPASQVRRMSVADLSTPQNLDKAVTSSPSASNCTKKATNVSVDEYDEAIEKYARAESAKRKVSRVGPGPKFRKAYHGDWHTEVQDITIINKEEISELRKQLSSKMVTHSSQGKQNPSLLERQASLRTSSKVKSMQSASRLKVLTGGYSSDSDSCSADSKESTITSIKQRDMEEDETLKSINLHWKSLESLPDEIPHKDTATTQAENAKSGNFNAPLISVEEVPEPQEKPESSFEPENLTVPGKRRASLLRKQRRSQSKSSRPGAGQGAGQGKEAAVPDWLVELTQKHNVTLSKST